MTLEELLAANGAAATKWLRSIRADHRVAFGHVLKQLLAAGFVPLRESDLAAFCAAIADETLVRASDEADRLRAEVERLRAVLTRLAHGCHCDYHDGPGTCTACIARKALA